MTKVLIGLVVGMELGFETILPDAAWRQLALFAMVNVIAALSLNVINGMAGQFSIGHAGFVGIGAYTAAVVSSLSKPPESYTCPRITKPRGLVT